MYKYLKINKKDEKNNVFNDSFKFLFVFSFASFLQAVNPSASFSQEINNANCENLYNKCMNKICFSASSGRCSCSATASSSVLGDSIGLFGDSLYQKAASSCDEILKSCPMLKRSITNKYKRGSDTDCVDLAINKSDDGLKQISKNSFSGLELQLKDCMKPLCQEGPDFPEYTLCFKQSIATPLLQQCLSKLPVDGNKDLLKEQFALSMKKTQETYCKRIQGGQVDEKGCYLEISLGTYLANNLSDREKEDELQFLSTGVEIYKTKKFYMGQALSCTEDGFDSKIKTNDVFKRIKAAEVKGKKLVTAGKITKTVGSALESVRDAKYTKKQGQMDSGSANKIYAVTGMGFALEGIGIVADIVGLKAYAKQEVDDGRLPVFCFIDNIPLIPEGTEVILNWVNK